MSLSDKYGIPQETVNQMVKDGVISCKYPRHEEVYNLYKTYSGSGKTKTDIYYEMADKLKMSFETIKKIVAQMGKN
jgi:hypothetical protein